MNSKLIYGGAVALAGLATVGMFGVGTTKTTTVAPAPVVTKTAVAEPDAPSASEEIHLEISGMT